jgi:glycosyltransferase involved in cell wall biosynthesis
MIITVILQVRNEETSGHLERFLKWNKPIYDNLIAYDDCSTDESVAMLKDSGAFVIEGELHSFNSELQVKQLLLDEARNHFPQTDWFLWLDADELLLGSRVEINDILHECVSNGFDGVKLPLVNLWRSNSQFRVDSGFNNLENVRFWKNSNNLAFSPKPGLHHPMHPDGMKQVSYLGDLRVLHFGFSRDSYILSKFHTYREAGQRGRNLWRLVDETGITVQSIHSYSAILGERFTSWFDSLNDQEIDMQPISLIEQCRLEGGNQTSNRKPKVTLVSLIYAGVDWLEFQYGELIKLQNEFGPHEVEILFVANDATPEVLQFLRSNCIPFVVAPGRVNESEWYINSVYRAYNFGVLKAQGEYVLLTNSDMAYMPGFLFNLLKHKTPNSYLVGKLIESGRLKPAEAAIKKNLGKSIVGFKRGKFYELARKISAETKTYGGLYMPLLAHRRSFLEHGGYPEGNILKSSLEMYIQNGEYQIAAQGEELVSGDFAFVKRLEALGWSFETVDNAIAYHFQEGEKSEHSKQLDRASKSGVSLGNSVNLNSNDFETFPFVIDQGESRLRLISSLDTSLNKGKVILIGDEFEFNNFISKVNNIQSIVTSNFDLLKFFSIDRNIHGYLLKRHEMGSLEILYKDVVSQVIKNELRNSFLPVEPESMRSKVARYVPENLRKIIRNFLD